ncbi:class I SAM-dependent methyltransferase [Parazoarcus communis]|uniref:class I SAM-dependent methyltransferase n=1 Tax=Parazoarcus communis TaxID=41977 RepID=UPI00131ED9A1|nr:class I SAM-dependent methyltransferase [Parazoarcus communis]
MSPAMNASVDPAQSDSSHGDPAICAYTAHYLRHQGGARYPAEHLVRILMGRHPRLALNQADYRGAPLLEVGCGDGRNLGLFHDLGFRIHATEVSAAICDSTRARLQEAGIPASLDVGTNARLPYPDASFRYLIAWNSCYYLEAGSAFADHVREYARVLTDKGFLILSVPMPTNYIFTDCVAHDDGSTTLTTDAFGVLQGARLQRFSDAQALQQSLEAAFADFSHGEIRADCFGVQNDHFLLVCRKYSPKGSPQSQQDHQTRV